MFLTSILQGSIRLHAFRRNFGMCSGPDKTKLYARFNLDGYEKDIEEMST